MKFEHLEDRRLLAFGGELYATLDGGDIVFHASEHIPAESIDKISFDDDLNDFVYVRADAATDLPLSSYDGHEPLIVMIDVEQSSGIDASTRTNVAWSASVLNLEITATIDGEDFNVRVVDTDTPFYDALVGFDSAVPVEDVSGDGVDDIWVADDGDGGAVVGLNGFRQAGDLGGYSPVGDTGFDFNGDGVVDGLIQVDDDGRELFGVRFGSECSVPIDRYGGTLRNVGGDATGDGRSDVLQGRNLVSWAGGQLVSEFLDPPVRLDEIEALYPYEDIDGDGIVDFIFHEQHTLGSRYIYSHAVDATAPLYGVADAVRVGNITSYSFQDDTGSRGNPHHVFDFNGDGLADSFCDDIPGVNLGSAPIVPPVIQGDHEFRISETGEIVLSSSVSLPIAQGESALRVYTTTGDPRFTYNFEPSDIAPSYVRTYETAAYLGATAGNEFMQEIDQQVRTGIFVSGSPEELVVVVDTGATLVKYELAEPTQSAEPFTGELVATIDRFNYVVFQASETVEPDRVSSFVYTAAAGALSVNEGFNTPLPFISAQSTVADDVIRTVIDVANSSGLDAFSRSNVQFDGLLGDLTITATIGGETFDVPVVDTQFPFYDVFVGFDFAVPIEDVNGDGAHEVWVADTGSGPAAVGTDEFEQSSDLDMFIVLGDDVQFDYNGDGFEDSIVQIENDGRELYGVKFGDTPVDPVEIGELSGTLRRDGSIVISGAADVLGVSVEASTGVLQLAADISPFGQALPTETSISLGNLAAPIELDGELTLPVTYTGDGSDLVVEWGDVNANIHLIQIEIETCGTVSGVEGDINGDGEVSFLVFLEMARNFGKAADAVYAEGDLNCDGAIGFPDFLILARTWGATE